MASTNTDFRLSVGYFEHYKVQKLLRRLGDHGVLSHMRLLRFVAQNRPDGRLHGMTEEDVEVAAGYTGAYGQFVPALIELHLIDQGEDGMAIHDWAENNPYAAAAPRRSEKARKAANVRHGKGDDAPSNPEKRSEQGMSLPQACYKQEQALLNNAPSMQQAQSSNAPSPYPTPYPDPSPTPEPSPDESPQSPQGAMRSDTARRGFDPADHFEAFWLSYPLKKSRDAAQRKFCTKVRSEATLGEVMAGLARAKLSAQWTKGGGQFIPHASTWLNGGGWKDDYAPPPTNTGGMNYQDRAERTLGWLREDAQP